MNSLSKSTKTLTFLPISVLISLDWIQLLQMFSTVCVRLLMRLYFSHRDSLTGAYLSIQHTADRLRFLSLTFYTFSPPLIPCIIIPPSLRIQSLGRIFLWLTFLKNVPRSIRVKLNPQHVQHKLDFHGR